MRATGLEVADIFRQIGPAYRSNHADALSSGQRRMMSAIEPCRTAALGGHVEQCEICGHGASSTQHKSGCSFLGQQFSSMGSLAYRPQGRRPGFD